VPLDYGDRVDGPNGVGPAASLTPPTDRDGRLHPRNPWVGLFLALLMLVIAGTGLVAVALEPSIIYASSNRRAGLLLLGPVIAVVAGTITLVRGFLAIGPWVRHQTTPRALRRHERAADLHGQSLWPLLVFGSLALAAFVVLVAIFSMYNADKIDLIGRLVQVEFLGFFALVWLGCLGRLAQKLYYRRFYVGRDPRGDLPRT
jgi:hypothetical protein